MKNNLSDYNYIINNLYFILCILLYFIRELGNITKGGYKLENNKDTSHGYSRRSNTKERFRSRSIADKNQKKKKEKTENYYKFGKFKSRKLEIYTEYLLEHYTYTSILMYFLLVI